MTEANDDSESLTTEELTEADESPAQVRVEFDPKYGFDQDEDTEVTTHVHEGRAELEARGIGRGGDINRHYSLTIEDGSGQQYTVNLDKGIIQRREDFPDDDTTIGHGAEVFVDE